MPKTTNTFNGGLNLDLSDMLMSAEMMRNAQNIRVIDLDGSNFAVTLIRGTEESFTLKDNYIPLVTQEYDGVLYIISGRVNADDSTSIEVGSYPSPDLEGGSNTQRYRAFRNIVSKPTYPLGEFNTTILGFELTDTIDMEIQPDFDGSVNVIFSALNRQVRIVNSNFVKDFEGIRQSPLRPEGATSNTYTFEDLDDETALVVSSSQVLGVDLISIEQGGSLIYGNYQYYFYLLTDDFAQSPLAGHSMLCQVFDGTASGMRGGTITEQTSKQVSLRLTNIDTSFTYLKVYFSFASGDEQSTTQLIELVSPIRITGTTQIFTHTGFESTGAVSPDVINFSSYNVDSAGTLAQAGGFLFLGNVTERNFDLSDLAEAAQQVTLTEKDTPVDFEIDRYGTEQGGYADYQNTYRRLGYRRGETYPFGMVFILTDGSLSPVFPMQGKDVLNNDILSEAQKEEIKEKGLFRFNDLESSKFYDVTGKLNIKHLTASGINPSPELLEKTIGFFFVRGERVPNQVVQGFLLPVVHIAPSDVSDVEFANTLYYDNFTPGTDEYGMVPTFDGILEAWRYDVQGGDDSDVIDDKNQLDKGYMPFIVKDMALNNPAPQPDPAAGNMDPRYWAFFSIDQLVNEPELITALNGRQAVIKDEGIVAFEWNQKPEKVYDQPEWRDAPGTGDEPNIGMYARMVNYNPSLGNTYIPTTTLAHVIAESFATGATTEGNRTFTSKSGQRFIFKTENNDKYTYISNQNWNSYFGVAFEEEFSTKGSNKPYAGNDRYKTIYNGIAGDDDLSNNSLHTYGVTYENNGVKFNGAHLVTIYPQSGLSDDITRGYEDIGNITYRICSPRYAWGDIGTQVDIFGGDTFITSAYRKLSQSGFRQTNTPADKKNINMGITFQMLHESKYSGYLRHPERFDASETEDRSFFPFKGSGDHNTWRRYRYPETSAYNLGFEETEGLQSFIAQSEFTVLVKNNFYTRVLYSNRYIPNAFRNGYRSFGSLSFRDYDTSLGAIIQLVNHQGLLLIVFEHGVGITAVEQRVQSGADQAGAVFLEAGDIIPANIQFFSRTIGAQDGKAVIVTPQAVYGMDTEKDKIWQVTQGLRVISDDGFSSFLTDNPIVNPRLGYDFQYNEVVFTTDNWTLCYREGMEKFTSFYSFKPELYATVGKQFRSFKNGRFHLHGADTRLIYGNKEDMYVEFVVNEGIAQAKVFDYINILSNEVRPAKVEFFTYDIESKRYQVLDTDLMQQYAHVLDEDDPFRDGENKIVFRDKRFAVQIPNTEIYKGELDTWGIGGRMRNDYLIVRLTYNTDKAAKVTAVLTEIRPSFA